MKKILFPTDFSTTSLNAFTYALQIAKRISAEIITLHVYDIVVTVPYTYDILFDYYGGADEWKSFENYKTEVPKLHRIAEDNQASGVKLSHVLEQGEITDTILEVAQRDRVDLIILGTKGTGGLNEVLIGTTAEKVMNTAGSMVIAVPDKCHYTDIEKILFITQFKKSQQKALHELVRFAEHFNAHIDALCVSSDLDTAIESALKDWKATFEHADVSYNVLTSRNVEETIFDYVEAHHINLLAMTVQRKGFLEKLFLHSVARKIAFHSTVPVLALK